MTGYVLALRDLLPEVTLFANDLRVPFSNNQAESDLQMANSAEDFWVVPDSRRHETPSQGTLLHLEAAKHIVDAMAVLTALFACAPWKTATPMRI
ncbi:MAG: IS66 family transposase [Actinobacteria bacterium]|nr:IS66 family transposase [Actinomycetota bacterium]MCL6105063.1 IS66 family transposase [Actinomycetota bacterium]